ncbi:MAG TPA: hypothetical protein VGG45_15700 [Terracidiphilus sp.]
MFSKDAASAASQVGGPGMAMQIDDGGGAPGLDLETWDRTDPGRPSGVSFGSFGMTMPEQIVNLQNLWDCLPPAAGHGVEIRVTLGMWFATPRL